MKKSINTQSIIRNSKGQFTNDPRPDRKTGKHIVCEACEKIKYVIANKIRRGEGRFCSRKCYWKWMKGRPSQMKGKTISEEGRKRMSVAAIGKHCNENNPQWKGDDVGYVALHNWVSRNLGRANRCETKDMTCKGRFEWANKSKQYKRDLEDWMSLCKSHHARYDVSKLTEKDVRKIKKLLMTGETQIKIANVFNISQAQVSNIASGRRW